jgi:hypothetical protein
MATSASAPGAFKPQVVNGTPLDLILAYELKRAAGSTVLRNVGIRFTLDMCPGLA